MRYGWSANSVDWEILSEFLLVRWKKVSFRFDSNVMIPKARGLYLIVMGTKKLAPDQPFDALVSPMYIGHSLNLQRRFKDHSNTAKKGNIRDRVGDLFKHLHFWFGEFPDLSRDELKKREQDLLDLFGPTLNEINSVSNGVKIGEPVLGQIKNTEDRFDG